MPISIIIVLLICSLGASAAVWMLVCNNRTYQETTSLIHAIGKYNRDQIDAGNYALQSVWLDFEQVGYVSHLWARFMLCDPWTLYPPYLRQLYDLEKSEF